MKIYSVNNFSFIISYKIDKSKKNFSSLFSSLFFQIDDAFLFQDTDNRANTSIFIA